MKKKQLIITTFLLILLIVTLLYSGINYTIQKNEYCKELGYEGADLTVYSCYREVPHESGIGYKRIHSGFWK